MAAAAQNLTPLIAECGGKDALLVGPDADLDAAADAAAWGAVSNAGQTCIGVERVYVVDAVYHSFVEKLSERMGAPAAGRREATYGPMTMPGQTVVEDHIADALARGGRAVLGAGCSAGLRRPGDPGRRAGAEHGGAGGDVRADAHRDQGGRPGGGGAYGQREQFALGSAVFAGNEQAMDAARALRSG